MEQYASNGGSNLRNLKTLDLNFNQLTKIIPPSISKQG